MGLHVLDLIGYVLGIAAILSGFGFVLVRSANKAEVEKLVRRADSAERSERALVLRVTQLELDRDHYKTLSENLRDSMMARDDIKEMKEDAKSHHQEQMEKLDLIHQDLVRIGSKT